MESPSLAGKNNVKYSLNKTVLQKSIPAVKIIVYARLPPAFFRLLVNVFWDPLTEGRFILIAGKSFYL